MLPIRTIHQVSLTCIILLISISLPSRVIGDEKKIYAFIQKNGSVDYDIKGNIINGSKKLTWSDSGHFRKETDNTIAGVMGITQETNKTTYFAGTKIYTQQADPNTYVEADNPVLKGLVERGQTDVKKFGEEVKKSMNARKIGKMVILGKECIKWAIDQMQSMSCDWQGVPLWSKSGLAGMEITTIATKITIGDVSQKDVTLPANAKIVRGKDPMKMLREMRSGAGSPSSKRPTVRPQGGTKPGPKSPPPDPMEFLKKLQEMKKQMPQGK